MVDLIKDAWRSVGRPNDDRPIYERTGQRISLPSCFTRQGALCVDDTRHLIRAFDGLKSDVVRELNILAPVRDGKTLVADVWLPDCIEYAPGPFLGVFQEDNIAKEHCELRMWPILRSVESIIAKLPNNGDHVRTQEILFSHMLVMMTGPAVSRLQSKGFRNIWCDEPWLYPKGRLDEAKGRSGDFKKQGIDKLLCTSQGGFAEDLGDKQNSDWYQQFNSGRLNEWHIRCVSCGEFQMPAWNGKRPDSRRSRWGIMWDPYRDDRGFWIIDKCLETVRFECRQCKHQHIDGPQTKSKWNSAGDYMVKNQMGLWVPPSPEFVAKESLHWNGVITYPWTVLLEEFLQARNIAAQGDRSKTIVFFQKKMAEFHDSRIEDEFDHLPTIEIVSEIPPEKPFEVEGVLFTERLAAADVQQSHFEIVSKAFSKQGDEITTWSGKAFSWSDVDEIRLRHGVPHEDMSVDCQHRRNEVIEECTRHGHVIQGKWACWKALEGTDVAFFTWKAQTGKMKGQSIQLPYSWPAQKGDPCFGLRSEDPRRNEFRGKYCQVIRWSNPWIKDVTADRRDQKAKVKVLIAAGDWNEEHSRQMQSEMKKAVRNKGEVGNTRFLWCRIGNRPNHRWDCSNMINVRAFMKHLIGGGEE